MVATTITEQQTRNTIQRTLPGLILRLEGLAVLITAITLYSHISGDWLIFALLLFTPDVAMLGYLFNARIGAITYNIGHFYALPLALGLIALAGGWSTGVALALIWAAHIGLDRLLGFGLKYADGFKSTHLERV